VWDRGKSGVSCSKTACPSAMVNAKGKRWWLIGCLSDISRSKARPMLFPATTVSSWVKSSL
jgi:hypothetical protein